MDVKEFLMEKKELINEEISVIFNEIRKKYSQLDPIIADAIDKLEEYSLRGGKRIRGGLILLSYEIFGGDPAKTEDALRVACAYELLHAFLLIHDDIMDASDTRRGKPSFHKIYEANEAAKEVVEKSSDLGETWQKKRGCDLAMVAGDALLFIANDLLIGYPQIHRLVNDTILNTCFGQILDYNMGLDEDKILKVYKNKTSKYTIEVPLQIGAILGGHSDVEILSKIAEPLGVSFQMQDDLLDIYGESGKDQFRDIKEGKKTYLMYIAMQNLDEEDSEKLESFLDRDIRGSEMQEIVGLVDKSDARRKVLDKVNCLANESLSMIDSSALSSLQKQVLSDFVELILKRKS